MQLVAEKMAWIIFRMLPLSLTHHSLDKALPHEPVQCILGNALFGRL